MEVNNPYENPYFLHANDSASSVMISTQLTKINYHEWAQAMSLALRSKNKLQFVDGTVVKSMQNDPSYMAWDRCNITILSWIRNTLEPSIARSVVWMNTAYDVWSDLKKRFYQGDVFRIADLQEQVYALKQGDLSIIDFYTGLMILWQELENFRPIPP